MKLFKSRAIITHENTDCGKSYNVDSIFDNDGCPFCQGKDKLGAYTIKYIDPSCDDCKHFFTYPICYPSGKCLLYNVNCGSGQYCDDFDKRMNI